MKLETILYKDYEQDLPQEGKHIIGQTTSRNTVYVYQAFNPAISEYAILNQKFGGPAYNKGRMTWIKPNFLWMMYRSGWASKPNQERILAIELPVVEFEKILSEAVHSSYRQHLYGSKDQWKSKLTKSDVRLQWDPDHDPHGSKLERRAIQLGIRGEMLTQFIDKWIVSILDITDFVLEQKKKMDTEGLNMMEVIKEQKIVITDEKIINNLELN